MHGALAGVQFVVHPLLAAGLLAGLAWGGLAPGHVPWHVILIQAFTPTALNTVMVSNLFHLDARLGSVLWLWNTILFCLGPLPLVLWWY